MLDCLAMKGRIATVLGDDASKIQADKMYDQLVLARDRENDS